MLCVVFGLFFFVVVISKISFRSLLRKSRTKSCTTILRELMINPAAAIAVVVLVVAVVAVAKQFSTIVTLNVCCYCVSMADGKARKRSRAQVQTLKVLV